MPKMLSRKSLLPFIAVLVAFLAYLYLRPLPKATPISQIINVPKTQAINLPWPTTGQAAVGASGYGVLAIHNDNKPVPIGSITKVITAMAVLKQKPIPAGSQGATITLGPADVALFNSYYAKDGSVAKVAIDEQLSEYQALETMLIPSANNIADSLAVWAFGSMDLYLSYANQMVSQMGLTNAKVGDASGFGDTTLSTASDLVKLGIAAMNNPTISQIVGQSSAQVPANGVVKNVNLLLGSDGIDGIKTGNTDKAGGCYLFAAQRSVQGHSIKLVGAVLGQADLITALRAAVPIIRASDSGFTQLMIVHKNQVLGYYQTPWGTKDQFKAAKDISLFGWKGQSIDVLNKPNIQSAPASSGSNIGSVIVKSGDQVESSPLVLSQDLLSPGLRWRIIR